MQNHENVSDLRAQIAELQERLETVRALCDAAEHVGIVSGGWFTVQAVRKAANGEPLPKPTLTPASGSLSA
jgi:N-methylhydantoinase B/oxoprolinase/acetone carboxylase alpha subunit